jgi:uncharacterized membrane protein
MGRPPSGLGVTLTSCGMLGGVADRLRAPRLDDLSPRERSRTWRLRFTVREWLSRSLVLVPSLYIAAALALGELVPRAEGERDLLSLKLDPDTARTILSAEASGMIAFTGLVVSIGVVVVQFGASQYTPRLVSRFTRDPIVKHSLGIFIAPAIFALVSLRSIGRDGSEVVPSLTIGVNMVLLIAAVLAFFALVSLLDLLRPRRVIAQMVGQASRAIRQVYPFPLDKAPRVDAIADAPVTAVVSHDGGSGVLSALDRARIVRAAARTGAVVEVAIGIGGYVPQGAPLFIVRGPVEGLDERELRRAAIVAEERTITQDPAFAIRAIVDIALRALSPAVNDPTTAVQVLDALDRMLIELSFRRLERGRISDRDGQLRLVYPNPGWAEVLDLALTEIRHYGANSPQIARRMRALILGLIEQAPELRRPALEDQLRRLDTAVQADYPDPIERAHATVPDHLGIGGTAA